MERCPNCDFEISKKSKFCTNCGSEIKKMKKLPPAVDSLENNNSTLNKIKIYVFSGVIILAAILFFISNFGSNSYGVSFYTYFTKSIMEAPFSFYICVVSWFFSLICSSVMLILVIKLGIKSIKKGIICINTPLLILLLLGPTVYFILSNNHQYFDRHYTEFSLSGFFGFGGSGFSAYLYGFSLLLGAVALKIVIDKILNKEKKSLLVTILRGALLIVVSLILFTSLQIAAIFKYSESGLVELFSYFTLAYNYPGTLPHTELVIALWFISVFACGFGIACFLIALSLNLNLNSKSIGLIVFSSLLFIISIVSIVMVKLPLEQLRGRYNYHGDVITLGYSPILLLILSLIAIGLSVVDCIFQNKLVRNKCR